MTAMDGPLDTHDGAAVPTTGFPEAEDYPGRLVFMAPYFTQVPLAEIFAPAVQDAVEAILPVLIEPGMDAAALAAVQDIGVLKAGDTMTGPLHLANSVPLQDFEAASKFYVDLSTTGLYLPLTGGTLTGDLNMSGHRILNLDQLGVIGDVTASVGVWANNQPGVFGFSNNGTNYVFYWGNHNWYDWWRASDGTRFWHAGTNGDVMSLDGGGNLHANGAISANGNISTSGTLSAGYISVPNLAVTYAITANTVTANAITSNGALGVAGNATVGGTLTASSTIQSNHALQAYIATGQGGFVGSWQGNFSNIGFININNTFYFGNADGNGSWTGPARMSLDPGSNLVVEGNLASAGQVSAPTISGRLIGGENGAGALQGYGGATITFNWAARGGGTWLSYRVDGAVEEVICTSVNAQGLQYFSGTGGPTTVGLAGTDQVGNPYYMYVDWVSDARIKHSIAPSKIDALALINQIEVSEFHVRSDAVAAIQPVDADAKAALRDAPDPFVPIGIVAQQARAHIPELVVTNPQHDPALPADMLGLNTPAALPYLIRAVQQLSAQVTALQKHVGAP